MQLGHFDILKQSFYIQDLGCYFALPTIFECTKHMHIQNELHARVSIEQIHH
ncbi:hypothetical protein D3C87_1083510 [compost metagenome]